MADTESIRVEFAFEGGQILAVNVTSDAADSVERALAASAQGTHTLETDDGRVAIVLARVLYAKRYARDSRVGFAND